MAQKKQTKRTGARRARTRALGAPGPKTDVTAQPAEMVVRQINLLCDGDTNVLFFREGNKLFMSLVPRT